MVMAKGEEVSAEAVVVVGAWSTNGVEIAAVVGAPTRAGILICSSGAIGAAGERVTVSDAVTGG